MLDTHFDPNLEKYILAEWGYTSFFSSKNTNSRGVAILFNNNFEFKVKGVYKDLNGNYLMVHIFMMNVDVLLINVYGPNKDDPDFYASLNEEIGRLHILNVIMAGDWNLVLDPVRDYQNYKSIYNDKARGKLEEIIEEYCLVDIWREFNPESQRYTWRRSSPLQQSRLDFFLISESICNKYLNADILPGYRTDHSMITLELIFGEHVKKRSFWKFNFSHLRDREFVTEINDLIERVIEQYAVSPYNRDNLSKLKTEDIQFTISDQLLLDVLLMEIRSKAVTYGITKNKRLKEQESQIEKEILLIEKKV